MKSPKILTLDIETAPELAYVWGLWQQNVPLGMIEANSGILCWAAGWQHEEAVHYASLRTHGNTKDMMRPLRDMMSEADAIITYNGIKFDIPIINRELLLHGLKPPAPSHQIDLLRTVKSNFKFVSNKLDYVVKRLGIGAKMGHAGFSVWKGCMEGDKASWKTMEDYNIQDVIVTEKLYDTLTPWAHNYLNLSVHSGELQCPNCGSHHFQKRGVYRTQSAVYQRYQCQNTRCGKWFKAGSNQGPKPKHKATGVR